MEQSVGDSVEALLKSSGTRNAMSKRKIQS